MIKLIEIVAFITCMIFYVAFAIFCIALSCVVIDNHINTDISYKCADGKHIKVTVDKRRDYITEETLENVTCE